MRTCVLFIGMAHTRSVPGSCEIIEIDNDEMFISEHSTCVNHARSEKLQDRDRRSLGSNVGRISSLEDDLNQLFEIFNRRASSQVAGHPHLGAGPSRIKSTKNSPGPCGSSPRPGMSDRVNLKQALRGLCISQASEMAAMRRAAKSGPPEEVGRILSMYHNVLAEETKPVVSEDAVAANHAVIHVSDSKATGSDGRGSHALIPEIPKTENPSSSSSLPPQSLSPPATSTSTAINSTGKVAKSGPRENGIIVGPSPPPPENSGAYTEEPDRNFPRQTEAIHASSKGGSRTPKREVAHKDEHSSLRASIRDVDGSYGKLSRSTSPPGRWVKNESTAKAVKHEGKGSALMAGQKKSSESVPLGSSTKGNKPSKPTRTASYFVKPVIKTKTSVKRKTKKSVFPNSGSTDIHAEVNEGAHQDESQVVCPRCQCVVSETWNETNQGFLGSSLVSNCALVNTSSLVSDAGTPCFTSDSSDKSKEVVETKGYSKPREKSQFTQSSKSSPGECSSTTSISEEINLSRPSCCDRPHMSKDVRWQAIRRIKAQHGALGLRNFNLLKKLGCGDIGTVYLAELMGTDCLFAIKVMDNDFLVRRKKILRAQTEREILRMLDHPFLPTLYSQFTSDNLSCLVMEYCPGGDLHVLRQKQPGRCFTEQAARFYVAEVLLALEYLHMLGVVYRDLKPENILVRDDGHIMLSDFDLSLRCIVNPMLLSPTVYTTTKRISGPCADSGCVQPFCVEPSCFSPRILPPGSKPRKLKPEQTEPAKPPLPLLVAEPTSARSNSFVGTHEYLAPEIIKGEGHGSAVDWWTFGIFLYELLYGRTPFKGSGNDETLANVVLETLRFPDSPLVSFQARDLIALLLVKDPENRLGTERGAAEIKQHPFFDGLNWALIRCAVPPQLPEPRGFGLGKESVQEKGNGKYLEYKASTGEHLEFEVF